MGTLIEFKNTNFGYDNSNCFNDFNMEIEEGDFISLIGPSGSGKTTLLKMLCHKLPNDTCFYNGESFSKCDVSELKKNIIVIFDLPFTEKTVHEEMIKNLRVLNFSPAEIDEQYREFANKFGIYEIDELDPNKLSWHDKYLIKILRYLIVRPRFLAIDCLFSNLTEEKKRAVVDYIKSENITVLNITTDLSDTLFGNKIFVLENFVLILEGSTITVLKTDTLLKRLGFDLPLAVDLSIELNHYDILKDIYIDKSKLVEALWK